MSLNVGKWSLASALVLSMLVLPAAFGADNDGVRKLHLVQDDAQDYMVSKIYILKYVQANDLMPWVSGIIKRYNINSIANCIEYGNNNQQILTVTCPVGMMPYVDDFISKVDRDIKIDGHVPGDIIKGTGITRAVYQPKYRSGQDLINVIVNAVFNEGPYGSLYGYDANSNQIYWKDNASNTGFIEQALGWFDRPAPQICFTFQVYEVRESTLRDLGIEYLAWKNGPGLNLFSTAWDAFSIASSGTAAIQALSGHFGGFFFAPQFDASFIRMLQQSGQAEIRNNANLTVSNSTTKSYELYFNPDLQNITKSQGDQTSVATRTGLPTGFNQLYLKIISPQANLHYGQPQEGYPANEAFNINNYTIGEYAKYSGTVFFAYNIQSGSVVERDNYGNELVETSTANGNVLIELNKEFVLGKWDKNQTVEQVIGMPFLVDIPILKYFFSTTTTSQESTQVILTVKAEMLNTAVPNGLAVGELKKLK